MIDFEKASNENDVENINAMFIENDNNVRINHNFEEDGEDFPMETVVEEDISYASCMVICGGMFNALKGNYHLKKYMLI